MPSTRQRKWVLILAGVAIAAGAGCGTTTGHHTAGPTTTLVTADRWHPPDVPPVPSTTGYCSAVVSIYKHVAELPSAATKKVRQQIVGDYLAEVPTMIAAAPPPVASDSKLYFSSVAEILGDLQRAGLDPKRLSDPNLRQVLVDPAIKASGDRVISFVKDNCNYSIGG